jgi:molecular chaperone GrpE
VTDRPTGEPRHEAPPEGEVDAVLEDDAATAPPETEPRTDTEPETAAEETVTQADVDATPDLEDEAAEVSEEDDLAAAQRALSERTADLQRLQAEYLNYKRRVDRDRDLVRENATFAALAPIVDVLDTIDRAREHGDLDEGFKAVAEQLEGVVTKAGLVKYGEPGDAFDPRIHEALSHIGEDPDVEVTTCKLVAKAGYRIGDRVVRAAQVIVVDPVSG